MVGRFERAFERLVEGSIAGLFRLRVQPAEIGRRLERAMLDGRVASVGATLAPNAFEVRLHPEDAAAFVGWEDALNREMETWLAELVYSRGLTTIGPVRVRIFPDPSVGRRSVRAEGRFAGEGAVADPSSGTTRMPPPLRLVAIEPGIPNLTLASVSKTVGRAEDNDFVLRDPEVSRHHARLEPDGKGWRVVDLGSTNGTWVNRTRIESAGFAAGDELSFGEIRFLVDSR